MQRRLSSLAEGTGASPAVIIDAMDNQAHYDRITDGWRLLLGENLHYGYFTREGQTLRDATDALVDALAALAPIGPGTDLLDVGCGIGAPAFRLAERHGCSIAAISVSSRGLAIAREACERKGLEERVVFYQRDGLDNNFPDASFDVAWVMESSHLMRDKRRLCAENHRVLRSGGVMLLCDLILKRPLTLADVYELREDLWVLERSFGKATLETLDFYRESLSAAGFVEINCRDISDEVVPTLDRWEENLEANRELLTERLSADESDDFARSCGILRGFFRRGLLGYGIVTGAKSSCQPPAVP